MKKKDDNINMSDMRKEIQVSLQTSQMSAVQELERKFRSGFKPSIHC